jgi:hypothetical protein
VLDVQTSKAGPLRTKSFENMKYLDLLQINGVRLKGCSLKAFPPNFHPDCLVVFDAA